MFNSNLSEPFREGFIQNIHIALTSVAHSLLGHHSSKVTFTSCTVLAASYFTLHTNMCTVYITSYQRVYGLHYFIPTCVRFILYYGHDTLKSTFTSANNYAMKAIVFASFQ